ncbi:MAG: hypothetical protein LBF88_11710 [Planctomycetaceae bacterium]|jgi:hypothetical protein|nr:hypothetical protein [Planctomycetaceae bacterium]
MMNIIEHYFIKRIDDALDDAQPLDGWTARYVHRNPKLREYYTKMLELELELRFPDTELPNNNLVDLVNNLVPPNNLNYRSRFRFNNRSWINAAVIILAFLTVFSLPNFLQHQPLPEQHEIVSKNSENPTEEQKLTEEQKIDLGEVWDELSFTAVPLLELVPPMENPFENPFDHPFDNLLLKFPVEPIVRFADHPLESTLTFLETAGIIRSTNHERD